MSRHMQEVKGKLRFIMTWVLFAFGHRAPALFQVIILVCCLIFIRISCAVQGVSLQV